MTVYMVRSDARLEKIDTNKLPFILKATAKKYDGRELTMAQCGAIAKNIKTGKVTEFCGRLFEVQA